MNSRFKFFIVVICCSIALLLNVRSATAQQQMCVSYATDGQSYVGNGPCYPYSLKNSLSRTCVDMRSGYKAVGTNCTSATECVDPYVAIYTPSAMLCVDGYCAFNQQENGKSCNQNAQCASGVCDPNSGLCRGPTIGETCVASNIAKMCNSYEASCLYDDYQGKTTCQANIVDRVLGEACDVNTAPCNSTITRDPNNPESALFCDSRAGKCAFPLALGAVCTNNAYNCEARLICAPAQAQIGVSYCIDRNSLSLGSKCSAADQCAPGLLCQNGICSTRSCMSNDDCISQTQIYPVGCFCNGTSGTTVGECRTTACFYYQAQTNYCVKQYGCSGWTYYDSDSCFMKHCGSVWLQAIACERQIYTTSKANPKPVTSTSPSRSILPLDSHRVIPSSSMGPIINDGASNRFVLSLLTAAVVMLCATMFAFAL